ncbi:MAG: hypothetical protein OEW35_10525 [Gammaproteobacteria bacterium]|nr:hypothetical protein [Gammaproteobacteria bacterium]MDH4255068.1 hypothetical protein [Gammaproteobacteria bacterium]MDH5309562.1 hypothetical protein [Gammaproteobacteria bacterium]
MRLFHCLRIGPGVALLLAGAGLAAEAEIGPTTVSFDTGCAPAVAAEFDHAVTLLHSFEYPETRHLFETILAQDPGCAMARWGIAMSIWHPLWAPPSQAELREGAAVLAATDGSPASAREAAYIDAARTFFASDDPLTHTQRAAAYERSMQALYETRTDDIEVAAFYALALLASAAPTDKTYAHQYKAAAILNWIREASPYHPGALHYLIHSFDYPGLAHMALGAATIYAEAAPDSAHAQHMPSHIFTRLGLWDRSIASNRDSTGSATAYTERAGLRGHYDEGLHSIDYLMYALLQTARDKDAKGVLQRLGELDKAHVDSFKAAYTYIATPARYALERRDWGAASRLEPVPADFPWQDFPWAMSMHHFAHGIGAIRSGNVAAAKSEVERIRQLQAGLDGTTLPYWREEMFVHADAVSAWIALAEGRPAEARRLAAAAADREDAVDKHPVTPGEILPARELYADLLAELGDHPAALAQYEAVLASAPKRHNAAAGAARAAVAAGLDREAGNYYRLLLEFASSPGADRPTVAEARMYLAAAGAAE